MQEGMSYEDGAHVWLHLPSISFLDYHPFCVASSAAIPGWENTLLLQCKSYDKWTDVRAPVTVLLLCWVFLLQII